MYDDISHRAFQQKVLPGKRFLLSGQVDKRNIILKVLSGRVPLFLRSRADKLIPRRAERFFRRAKRAGKIPLFELKIQ